MIDRVKTSLEVTLNGWKAHFSIIVAFWVLTIASRLYANGDSYGFDFSVFQPDGVLYALRTFMFLGHDQLTAARQIEEWYFIHGASRMHFDPASILPGNSPAWGLVAPRVLYPLLSVPFVAIFGMNGLLVIPSLSLLLLVLSIYFLSRSLKASNFGLFLSVLVLLSPTVLRWMVANITDSLFVGLFALSCLVIESKNRKINNYLSIGLLIVLTSITRFATPIWLALALADFSKGERRRASFITLFCLIASIPTYLTQPSNSVLPREGDLSVLEKVFALPVSFIKVGFFEIAELAVLDKLLLLILAAALVVAICSIKSSTSMRFLLVLLATWAIGALNGSIGVNFRYQLPVLPFAGAVLIANYRWLGNWLLGRIRDVESEEAKQ